MSNMLSISKIYTLVPMQEGMLYNWLLDKSSAAYVQQLLFEVSGSFDTNIMKQCFKALAENHDVLRTNFINEGLTKARQVVFKEREIEICEYDLSSETDENIDERLNQLVYEDKKRGFDLAKSSLMRITIIKLSANKYTIIWSNHHIIMDGWSRSILINEFFQYYSYIKNGLKIPNKNDYDFSDYVKWIEKSNKERSAEYWKKYLDSYEQSAVIPKKSVNSENEYLTGTVEFEINKRDYEKIEKITGECSVTVNTFFQCVWGILLQKYNNTTDVVYGNVVSGRNYGIYGLDKMVGVFINTVPVRIQTTQEDTLLTLIKKVQEQTLESSKYENLTLAEIQSGSSLKQALIDNIIAFENYPLERGIQNLNESNKLGFVIGEVGVVEQIDYDFGVTFIPWNGLKIKMRFNRNVYSEQFVESIAGHLLQLIKLVIDNPNRLIKNLSVLTDEEKDEIIKWGTGNKTSDISHGLLHSLFEKCAESRPDDTAVSCSINFDLLAEKVSQDCIMPGELKKLKQMIFTKNKYIYKYEKSDLLKSIIDECDYNNIRLLRTNTHKLVAVNNTLYCLLDCLDGRCSLESVYNEILNKSLKLKAWKIENNEYGNLEGEEFSCNTNFESFIRLISCLINNNVIEFVGLNKAPCTFNYSEMQVRNEEFTKNCSDNLQINKKGPGVLLIGDTPGPATTGLLYIASYLRRNGIEAYCRWNDTDRRNNNLEKNIRKLLNEVKPDIVGISMKWFLHMARVIEIARIIKEYSKNIKVVIGGNSASFYDVDLIKTGNIDYIVRGDGELPFLKICQNAEYIPNCTYIVDNQIVRNEITYVQNEENSKDIYLSNLDEIFVDKEDIYKAPYFFIFTGKGCSMNCFYCAGCKTVQKQSFNRPKPFMRGIEQVRKDIMAVKPYTGVFMFDFDLPNYDSSGYYEQLWSGLGLKNHFCMFYFWKLPTEEFLEMVSKEFKYVYINIDLASMSERHRKYLTSMRVVKPQPEDAEIFSLFEKCDMYDNIEITINQIAGLPYFTKEDAVISEKVVEQLLSKYKRFKGIDWGRLHAQPGASLSTDASEFDMHSNASEFEDFLKYSRMNLTEVEIYPDLANTYYPFISFNDDSVNSTISKHYIRLNELIEKSSTRNNKLIINDKLTYGELNYKADLLADYLLTHGIGSGDIVALLFPRCIEMMIAVLGVLKSGAAYLPLDPAYPYERLKYIIEDSGASRLISFETHRVSEWFGENTFFMDQINSYTESNPKDAATLVRNTKVSPEDISYIIYTSGTTGRPKGIKISHKSISGTIKWRAREYGLNSTDNVLQLFSYSFDGFLTSMFTPLASGACAVIVTDDDINDPNAISNIIVRHKVSHFISVPALFHTILETMNEHDIMSLRVVTLAGDKISPAILKLAKGLNPELEIVNEYGPTESTVATTISRNVQRKDRVTIGRPIDNTTVFILDSELNILPKNIQGEIYIGGDRLAKGYVNNAELTMEKFIKNPFEPSGFLYKTGDTGRWTDEGEIEFIGRNDDQVKIRGYRIETSEIEGCLTELEDISQALVIDREDSNGSKYLCAYIIPASDTVIDIDNIIAELKEKLADYMVPQKYVLLDEIPLTLNGKVDRTKLPKPDMTSNNYVEPSTETEIKIADVWREVLLVDRIGNDDNFLNLGGDSIKAMQVIARLQKANIRVKMKDIFKYPTIRSLSAYAAKQTGHDKLTKDNHAVRGSFALTPIQKWFFEQNFENKNHWNQAVMLFRKDGFDERVCRIYSEEILKHHDALRIVFSRKNEDYEQYNRDVSEAALSFFVYDFSEDDNYEKKIVEEANRIQAGLNIEKGPMMSIGLFKTSSGDHLLIAAHHLVIDAVSMRIILEDFCVVYEQSTSGKQISLQSKTSSYKQWAEQLERYAVTTQVKNEIPYWNKVVQNSQDVYKKVGDIDKSYRNYGYFDKSLSQNETEILLTSVHKPYNTEINDLLLAALAKTLNELLGCEKCIINMEGHGRQEILADIDLTRTVGWFTCSYPVLLQTQSQDIGMLIKTTKEDLRRIPNKGIGYGILRYITSDKDSNCPQMKVEPQIGFNYLGQVGREAENEVFKISSISFGDAVDHDKTTRPYIIDLSIKVVLGLMHVRLNYNKSVYSEDNALEMLNKYLDNLKEIIVYCNNKDSVEITASDIGDVSLSFEEVKTILKATSNSVVSVYPLSPTQEGMLFHSIMDKASRAYFQQIAFTINGDLNVTNFKTALYKVFESYDTLKTVFIYYGIQNPRQIVISEPCLDVYYEEISSKNDSEQQQFISEFLAGDREKGFDIEMGVLNRISILKTNSSQYRIVWSFHHILMDGWCIGILIKELFSMYSSICEGKNPETVRQFQYKNYITWLGTLDREKSGDYWDNYLSGVNDITSICPQFNTDEYLVKEHVFTLGDKLSDKLGTLAVSSGVTLNTVFQTVWALLLRVYNNSEDVIFGSVYSGRSTNLEGAEKIIGLFINTLPVRVYPEDNKRVLQLLKEVQASSFELEQNQYVPLSEINSKTIAGNKLFDHIIAFENYPLESIADGNNVADGIRISKNDICVYEQTNYAFNITVIPEKNLKVKFKYNSSAFEDSYIDSIARHLICIAEIVTNNPRICIGDIDILSAKDKESIKSRMSTASPDDRVLSALNSYSGTYVDKEQLIDFVSSRKLHILNKSLRLQAEGVPGELYISCSSIDCSCAKENHLITNPYNKEEYLFKTGLIVRIDSNNHIKYIGLSSGYAEISGKIISLDKIRSILLESEDVENALVLAKKSREGITYLIVYITLKNGVLMPWLSYYLEKACLPEDCQVCFIRLQAIPSDFKYLPEPANFEKEKAAYMEAQNSNEKLLADIWRDVLKKEQVGVWDNFFDLGGDSIKAIQVVSRLYQHKMKLEVKDIFSYPHIRELQKYIVILNDEENCDTLDYDTQTQNEELSVDDIDGIIEFFES